MMDHGIKQRAFDETYEILEKLGSGSGGTVYKAYHKHLEKYVVLKRIHDHTADILNRRTETDILKNLRWPYLPQVLDFMELDDEIYTVMDFIPGDTFQNFCDAGRTFSQREVLKYASQLFETLAYIHGQKPKIIHGDIKPDNLMLTPEDNICLIDFNISAFMTGAGIAIKGYTAGYASPEQIAQFQALRQNASLPGNAYEETELLEATSEKERKLFGDVDERSDLYSAAATLRHILTGKTSEGFSYILNRAMEEDPKRRFQSASEVVRALSDIRKLDGRYKRLMQSRNLSLLLASCILCLGIGMTVFGRQKMRLESHEQYERSVLAMEELNAAVAEDKTAFEKKRTEFEELYQTGLSINDQRLDAYLQRVFFLYYAGLYEDDIAYIETEIMSRESLKEQEGIADVYYLYGSCFSHLPAPDYESAAYAYRNAIAADGSNSNYYRDLAIACARLGKTDAAQEAIAEANRHGITDDELKLAEGELHLAKQEGEAAIACFQESIFLGTDSYTKMRAYLGLNEAYRLLGVNEDHLMRAANLLDRAQTDLPVDMQPQILQSLAQDYIDLFTLTGNTEYARSGLGIFDKVEQNGWGSYTTKINRAFYMSRSALMRTPTTF